MDRFTSPYTMLKPKVFFGGTYKKNGAWEGYYTCTRGHAFFKRDALFLYRGVKCQIGQEIFQYCSWKRQVKPKPVSGPIPGSASELGPEPQHEPEVKFSARTRVLAPGGVPCVWVKTQKMSHSQSLICEPEPDSCTCTIGNSCNSIRVFRHCSLHF